MADFGYFSDTDDSAVDELISQTKDLCVLEQVSKINCSNFTDSLLPTDLDTRFQKLKSSSLSKANFKCSVSCDDTQKQKESSFKDEMGIFSDSKQNPDKKMKETPNGDDIFLPLDENPDAKKGSASKSVSGSLGSPLGSSNSSMDSPPLKTGCFWCSPKKVSKQKKKENINIDWGINKVDDDELLSVLNTFSFKEQQKILKKAVKEEEKITREAEKIVKWAKQASNRMSFQLDIEDELGDGDGDAGDGDHEKRNF